MPLIRGVVRISLWGAVPAMSAAFGPSFSRTCCARDTAGAGVNARVKRHKGCSGSNKAPTHRWSQKEMHDLVWGLAGSFSVGIFGGGRSAVTSSWGHGEFSRWYSGGERSTNLGSQVSQGLETSSLTSIGGFGTTPQTLVSSASLGRNCCFTGMVNQRFTISQSDVEYVQGKPYRFSIAMKKGSWHFEDCYRSFTILGGGGEISF
jgi:hypothetical protein